jgi:thiol:disulfide interchange protein
MQSNEILQIKDEAMHHSHRMRMKIWRILAVWLLVGTSALAMQFRTATKVSLELDSTTARPGDTVTAALRLQMDEGWHTYWVNPGTGLPTEIKWDLPEGVTAGALQWPAPEKYMDSVSGGYVYHDEVYLLVSLAISKDVKPGELVLAGEVSWLECMTSCIPGDAVVSATLVVGSEKTPSANVPIFELWRKRIPVKTSDLAVTAVWGSVADDGKRSVRIEWKSSEALPAPDFYPYEAEDFKLAPETESTSADGVTVLSKTLSKFGDEWPKELRGVLIANTENLKESAAYEVTIPVGAAVETSTVATVPPPVTQTGAAATKSGGGRPPITFMAALWLAFLGGMILNVMPCVLPVISLKILSFVNQSKESPGKVRVLGFYFAAGVFVSFMVLAALVLVVKVAGGNPTWGQQFQDPRFLVVMTVLLTLIALNLFGVFEVVIGGSAMGAAGKLASKEGPAGAFFNGLLVTVLATPCTAPFLGVAMGFAFAQPAMQLITMFMMAALGMSLPYVLLSMNPKWLKLLPKPGAWMETFKVAMGFPMLATAIWLFSLAVKHFPVPGAFSGAFWLGIFLVFVALAAWMFGAFVQRSTKRKGVAWALIAVFFGTGYLVALEGQLQWRDPMAFAQVADTSGGGVVSDGPGSIVWSPWSREAVAAAREQGRPVLVDFTADWCFVCQANKKIGINVDSVKARLKELKAVTLIGDFTRKNPAIAGELKRYNRAGVPLVLVYPADLNAEPIILPEVLTPGIVLDALEAVTSADKGTVK